MYIPRWPEFFEHETPVNMGRNEGQGPFCQVCFIDKRLKINSFPIKKSTVTVHGWLMKLCSSYSAPSNSARGRIRQARGLFHPCIRLHEPAVVTVVEARNPLGWVDELG
jgi:hypothetical protein